jgi:hypothetical protein
MLNTFTGSSRHLLGYVNSNHFILVVLSRCQRGFPTSDFVDLLMFKEDDDYICPSCRELDMDNEIQHIHLKCIIKHTVAKLERTNENTESHKYRQKKGSRTNNTKTNHVQSSLTQPENYRTEINILY